MCNGLEQPRKQQRSDLNGPVDNNNTPEVGTLGCSAARLPADSRHGIVSFLPHTQTHAYLGSVSFPELTINTMSVYSRKSLNYTHGFDVAT